MAAAEGTFDPAICAPHGFEVHDLARRVAQCADEADGVLSQLGRLLMEQWQSPAGDAYRRTLAVHMGSLRNARDALQEASAVVTRHAMELAAVTRRGF
ncbi:hypothetical protein BIU82_11290 [Arthrobacter sp. SW1]|nr:hypothetical protein BIU82_11290 [Arthrobacter sp. SW1]